MAGSGEGSVLSLSIAPSCFVSLTFFSVSPYGEGDSSLTPSLKNRPSLPVLLDPSKLR